MMSSTSKNLTKIPVTTIQVPVLRRTTDARPAETWTHVWWNYVLPFLFAKPFCPKRFPPTRHEPCCRSACLAPILLSTVVLQGIAAVLATAASNLAGLLEGKKQEPEVAYNMVW